MEHLADVRGVADRPRPALWRGPGAKSRLGVRSARQCLRAGRSRPADRDGTLQPRGCVRRSGDGNGLYDRGPRRRRALSFHPEGTRQPARGRTAAGHGNRRPRRYAQLGCAGHAGAKAVRSALDRPRRSRGSAGRPAHPRGREGRGTGRTRRRHPHGHRRPVRVLDQRWAEGARADLPLRPRSRTWWNFSSRARARISSISATT